MQTEELDGMKSRLDDLEGNIETARERLEGIVGPANETAGELTQRHAFLHNKLESAAQDKNLWDLFHYEIKLDIISLEEDFGRWVNFIDKQYHRNKNT